MNNTFTYDDNHQIEFNPHLQYELIKFSKRFKDPRMFKTFLQAYDLTPETYLALGDLKKLCAHIKQIEKDYYCYPELIKHHGILHLLEQKQKNLQSPFTQEILEQQLSNQHQLEQFIQAYFNHPENKRLPIVQWAKFLLEQPRLKARYQGALKNTLFILVQQGFTSVTQVIEGLIELGLPAKNLIVYTKPHTSTRNKALFEQLRDTLGFEYIQPDIELNATQDNFDEVKANGLIKLVDSVKAKLAAKITNHLCHVAIHDEGGKVLHHPYFLKQMAEENPDLQFSISEHTVSGFNTRKEYQQKEELGIAAACHTMATSWLKADKESLLIANASFKAVKDEIEALSGIPTISVIGIGNIGSIFVEYLIKHYEGKIKLILKTQDIEAPKFLNVLKLALEKQMLDESIYPKRADIASIAKVCEALTTPQVIKNSKLVFSCAGVDVTLGCDQAQLNSKTPHKVKLFSLSSAQREFKSLLNLLKAPGQVRRVIGKDFESTFQHLTLRVKNFGKPIIFDDNIDGVVPHEIQLIRALAICTCFQQLEYLSLLQSIQATNNQSLIEKSKCFQNQRPLIKLDIALQVSLWQAFCQFQRRYIQLNPTAFSGPLLGIWDAFLSPAPATELVIERSVGQPFSMACQGFTPFNAIMRFDDNHTLHLSYIDKHLELVFRKWDNEPIYDYLMLKKLLTPYFDLEEFYMASDFRKVQLIVEKILPHSFFKPQSIPLDSQEKLDYVALRSP